MHKKIILLFIALASNLMQAAAFNQPDAQPLQDVTINFDNQSTHTLLVGSQTTILSTRRNIALAPIGITIGDLLAHINVEGKTFRVAPPTTLNDVVQYGAHIAFIDDFHPASIFVKVLLLPPPIPITEVSSPSPSDSDYSDEDSEESDEDFDPKMAG